MVEKRKRKDVSLYALQQWDAPRSRRSGGSNDKGDIYEVEYIEKMRLYKGKPEFYIKWKGYPQQCNTWEPQRNLKNCAKALREFEKRQNDSGSDEVKALPPPPDISSDDFRAAARAGVSPETKSTIAEDVHVSRILKAMSYEVTTIDGERDLKVVFKVVRSDGEMVEMDNKVLREKYPYLLLDFYEERVRSPATR